MIKKLTIILLGLFIVFLYMETFAYAQEARGGGIDYLASIKKAKKEFSIPLKYNYQREVGRSSIASTGFTVAGAGNAGGGGQAGGGGSDGGGYTRDLDLGGPDGGSEGSGGGSDEGGEEPEPRPDIPEGDIPEIPDIDTGPLQNDKPPPDDLESPNDEEDAT